MIVTKTETAMDEFQRKKRTAELCSYEIIPDRAGPTTFEPLLNFTEAQACQLDYYLAAILTEAPPAGTGAYLACVSPTDILKLFEDFD